jgi:hypothetical protein
MGLVSFCFCVFLFFFAGYELVGIFMNGSVQSGVNLLMGELCVAWSGWSNLLCWMSIKFERWLKLQRAANFLDEGKFFNSHCGLVSSFGFWIWFSRRF